MYRIFLLLLLDPALSEVFIIYPHLTFLCVCPLSILKVHPKMCRIKESNFQDDKLNWFYRNLEPDLLKKNQTSPQVSR